MKGLQILLLVIAVFGAWAVSAQHSSDVEDEVSSQYCGVFKGNTGSSVVCYCPSTMVCAATATKCDCTHSATSLSATFTTPTSNSTSYSGLSHLGGDNVMGRIIGLIDVFKAAVDSNRNAKSWVLFIMKASGVAFTIGTGMFKKCTRRAHLTSTHERKKYLKSQQTRSRKGQQYQQDRSRVVYQQNVYVNNVHGKMPLTSDFGPTRRDLQPRIQK